MIQFVYNCFLFTFHEEIVEINPKKHRQCSTSHFISTLRTFSEILQRADINFCCMEKLPSWTNADMTKVFCLCFIKCRSIYFKFNVIDIRCNKTKLTHACITEVSNFQFDPRIIKQFIFSVNVDFKCSWKYSLKSR